MTLTSIHQPRATSVGVANVMTSEWTKLRSVRSTYWTVVVAVISSLFVTGMSCFNTMRDTRTSPDPSYAVGDPTNTTLVGLYIGAVAFGVLGVLAISSEYGTGMIRAALTAVPQRRAFLTAKGIVLALATLVVGELLSFGCFLLGSTFLNRAGVGLSLSDKGALRAVVGGGLYLTAICLVGFGFGALIRRTAGGLSAFFFVLFALNPLVDLLPTHLRNDIIKYLPLNAGAQILVTNPGHGALGTWAGFGVLCLYAFVPIAIAMYLITHRDA